MSEVILQILAGLSTAAVLFLVASGFTLVFGALRIINLAHGSVYLLGAFMMASVAGWLGGGDGTFWVSVLAAGLTAAGVGAVIELLLLRRIYSRDLLTQLLVTFGLVLILGGIARGIWGTAPRSVSTPPLLDGGVELLGQRYPVYSLFLIALGLATAVALWLVMQRTALGKLVRAAVSDRDLLEMAGVNVPLLFTGVFTLGAFLAGVAGAVIAPQQAVAIGADADVIVKAIVVVVIGGMGSLGGALVGSVLVGVADAFGLLFFAGGSLIVIFGVLVIVLTIRPQGLFGSEDL